MNRFWMILLCLLSCKSEIYAQNDTTIINDYKSRLDLMVKNVDDVNQEMILSVIPSSMSESKIFYALDYDDRTSSTFRKLVSKMSEYAMSDRTILVNYLYVSEYVDGYFAEDYFDDIEKIAIKKQEYFCDTVSLLDKKRTIRLTDIFLKYCD